MHAQVVLSLGPALMPDFMTGALFHSILAWPTAEEGREFHRVSNELIVRTIRLANAESPDIVKAVKDDRPQYDWRSIDELATKRKPALGYLRVRVRLRRRMAAARAGIGKMHKQIFWSSGDFAAWRISDFNRPARRLDWNRCGNR